jgi:hypothetical protein
MDKGKAVINPANLPYSADFLAKLAIIKKDMIAFYTKIGEESTPQIDGSGRRIVEKRPDGMDYIIETYMRKKLGEYFPGWSLEMAAPLHFLGSEWVVAEVSLCIIDEYLLAFGITPPVRRFFGVDSVRIQFKKGMPHTPDNIIDVGDNCKQAVSAAFKYAINRLTNIGDDVYGKRIDLEGAGSIDSLMSGTKITDITAKAMFNEYCKKFHIMPSKMYEILGIKSSNEITDYQSAYQKVKEYIERR